MAPGEGETLDAHCGSFRIFQAARGHRYSTDDLLVAWWGVTSAPRVARLLDLGSGIGSVALAAAWKLPGARVVTVEAQPFSIALARKSVRYNGLESRFRLLEGDFRDPALLAGEEPFDLVLGAPPYFEPGTATEARHPQAVPARITTRGGVEAYAAAARRALAPGALFAFVWPVARGAEAEEALARERLVLLKRRDVVFREEGPPLVALFAAARAEDLPPDLPLGPEGFPVVEPPLVVRRRDGRHTAEYAGLRLAMGFPPGDLSTGRRP
jgi:tRNA1(Val) A37 N6-methylase TrmN6